MKLIKILIILLNFSILNATVYENSEDGTINRWTISDGNSALTTVTNLIDTTNQNHFMRLKGEEYASEYRIGNFPQEAGNWNNTNEKYLLFDMRNSSGFLVDIIVNTTNGLRFLRYSDVEEDAGISDEYINFGLGYDIADGSWHKVSRNLEDDLKKFEPNIEILSVSGLLVRGDIDIDNIELTNNISRNKAFIVYEDAEDQSISRWTSESGTSVENINDTEINSRVIKFKPNNNNADSYQYVYQLEGLNNKNNFNLMWDMKTSEGLIVDVLVSTLNGDRELRYNDTEETTIVKDGTTLAHGLGFFAADGIWHTHKRNLEQDLKDLEPNNKLLEIRDFTIRIKGQIDNIELYNSPSIVLENAEAKTTSNWSDYSLNGGVITNKYDTAKKSRVISLKGNGYANQYILGADYMGQTDSLNETKYQNIQWSMKNSDGFVISLIVNTKDGVRYINYYDGEFTQPTIDGDTLVFSLGQHASDGKWHTFIRNIQEDIFSLEPNNKLLAVDGFLVTGSMLIDDLELFNALHPTKNKPGVALTFDDTTVDAWFSQKSLFDKYDAKVTFFVSHFYSLEEEQIDKLRILENSGSEIGCHTYNHKGVERDFHNNPTRIEEYINAQIKPAYDGMIAAGFHPKSFAYPYGEHDENYDNAVKAYFPYLRSTYDFFEEKMFNQSAVFHDSNKYYTYLSGRGVDDDYHDSMKSIERALIKARKNGEIITFFAHNMLNVPNKRYNISPRRLEKIMEISKSIGLKFYTFAEAYQVTQ